MAKVASHIYDGVAEYGKIQSILGAVIATLVGIVMLGVGIYFLVSDGKNEPRASGQTRLGFASGPSGMSLSLRSSF